MEVRSGGGRGEHAEVMLDQTTENKGGQGHRKEHRAGQNIFARHSADFCA